MNFAKDHVDAVSRWFSYCLPLLKDGVGVRLAAARVRRGKQMGLINRAVPAEGLMDWALETASQIAAHSPSAVQAVKRQISATIADHARSREAMEQELGDRVRASAHFKEGVAAFLEKRRPSYD